MIKAKILNITQMAHALKPIMEVSENTKFYLKPGERANSNPSHYWITLAPNNKGTYRQGKIILKHSKENYFKIGLHVEKGVSKEIEKDSQKIINKDWAWWHLMESLQNGHFAKAIADINIPDIKIIVDGHIYDDAENRPDEVITINYKGSSFFCDNIKIHNKGLYQISSGQKINNWDWLVKGSSHADAQWWWTDFYILCDFTPSNDLDAWDARKIWLSYLNKLSEWIR